MKRKGSLRGMVTGVIFSLVGSAMIFVLLFYMNRFSLSPEKKEGLKTVNFEVKKKKKEKPKPKKEIVRKQRQPQKSKRNLAPIPQVGTNLSGIKLDIPDFDASDLDLASEGLLGDLDKVVMTEESVDQKPRVISRGNLEYPHRARTKNITGYATFSVLISISGEVLRVKLLESSPPGVFDLVAEEYLRTWTFQPATYQGQPVQVWATQSIRFELQ